MSKMASQITSLTIVYLTAYSGTGQRKHIKLRDTGLCERNSPVTGAFPALRASNAENVSIWGRHHIIDTVAPIADYIIGVIFQNGELTLLTMELKSKYIKIYTPCIDS